MSGKWGICALCGQEGQEDEGVWQAEITRGWEGDPPALSFELCESCMERLGNRFEEVPVRIDNLLPTVEERPDVH